MSFGSISRCHACLKSFVATLSFEECYCDSCKKEGYDDWTGPPPGKEDHPRITKKYKLEKIWRRSHDDGSNRIFECRCYLHGRWRCPIAQAAPDIFYPHKCFYVVYKGKIYEDDEEPKKLQKTHNNVIYEIDMITYKDLR